MTVDRARAKRDANTECEWDRCEDEQFEDWYFCEHHARLLSIMNNSIAQVAS